MTKKGIPMNSDATITSKVEQLIGDMFEVTAEDFFAAHPEARPLVEQAVALEDEPGSRPGWGSPQFEAIMDDLETRYRRHCGNQSIPSEDIR